MKKIINYRAVLMLLALVINITVITGCQKDADPLPLKTVDKPNVILPPQVFVYELHVYNSKGEEYIYINTTHYPLTKLDSSIFVEEAIQDSRKFYDILNNKF